MDSGLVDSVERDGTLVVIHITNAISSDTVLRMGVNFGQVICRGG